MRQSTRDLKSSTSWRGEGHVDGAAAGSEPLVRLGDSSAVKTNRVILLAACSVANRSSAGWSTSRCLGLCESAAAWWVSPSELTIGNSSPERSEPVVLVHLAWSGWASPLTCSPASLHRWTSPCFGRFQAAFTTSEQFGEIANWVRPISSEGCVSDCCPPPPSGPFH